MHHLFALALASSVAMSVDTLPLLAPGGRMSPEPGKDRLEIVFKVPTPGVWYLWLKVAPSGAAEISYDLDGVPVKAPRGTLVVPAGDKSRWLHRTAHEKFFAQVHADAAGEHRLGLRVRGGKVEVEKAALTLAYLAEPTADGATLDHSRDPGRGRAYFPVTDTADDGFREGRALPETKAKVRYFIDADKGDDASDGLSPAAPWKSFRRANSMEFGPGNAILLKRGCTWREGLSPRGDGAPGKPVTLGAYGEGPRPVVDGGNGHAVRLDGNSHWVVRDLELTSDMHAGKSGLRITTRAGWNGREKEPQPRGIGVYNVVSHDNGDYGILVGSDYGEGEGYDGVRIENCLAYANVTDGIKVGGTTARGARNTVIRYCTAWSNMTLAGMWIESAQNGLIERCKAYNNFCYGIWVWNAVNVTIRHCEAYRGIGPNLSGDEGGFDIDWSSHACTIEYCYSHHNNGMGYLLMGLGYGDYYAKIPKQSRHNIVRYCVSVDDNPGIWNVETWEFGKVYNNTIATSRTGTKAVGVEGWPMNKPGGNADGGWPGSSDYLNNILATANDSIPLVASEYTPEMANNFDGNLYHRYGAPGPLVHWGGVFRPYQHDGKFRETAPVFFPTVDEFRRAAGQEKRGLQADPRLPDAFLGEYGRLPLASLRPAPDSPAARAVARVVLSRKWLAERAKILRKTGAEKYGIPMAPSDPKVDYWGVPLPKSGDVSIGAGEPAR